jgi:hypothetical protein
MYKNIIYIIVSITILLANNINESFGKIIFNETHIDSPFSGGFNKPKIQWIDWDEDGDSDLFLLDEDGCIKYYQNNGFYNNDFSFELITTCFEGINNINWFYFADYDSDFDYDLVTQDPNNIDCLIYYENISGMLNYVGNITNLIGENISIQSVMTPTFIDIDNDQDLDFFVGNIIGTVSFYENQGFLDNKPILELVTDFWEEIYIVGSSLNNRHGASAINFIDLDNDSDFDLSWGDYYQQSLYIITNIGDQGNAIMDIDNIISQYPLNDPIITAGLNMPTFTDIDLDGDQDLFVTVMSGAFGYQLINNFYFYRNEPIDGISIFEKVTDNFIDTFDLLSDINLEYFDFDNDSDLDLIIGTDFDPTNFPWVGKLVLFENIGLDENNEPVWLLLDDSYLGEELGNNLSPVTVDIDSDNDFDLFIGNFNGTIQFFENIGNQETPIYEFVELLSDIDLSGYSSPEFIDMDSDQDYDLLVGNMDGNIFFYENIGDIYNYNFQLNEANFQNIDVGTRSMPLIYDHDYDGDPDLLIGSGSNDISFFENTGNFNFSYSENESIFNLGKNSSPEIYRSSNHKGLVIGLSTGGMYYINQCNLDFNNDTFVNIVDVVIIINYIINPPNNTDNSCYDINDDIEVNILDVVSLIDYIFTN